MNKYLKKLLPLCFTAVFTFTPVTDCNALSLSAAPVSAYGADSGISTQSDEIVWRYKIENGKTYKRKYNLTTEKWIGNWILVP